MRMKKIHFGWAKGQQVSLRCLAYDNLICNLFASILVHVYIVRHITHAIVRTMVFYLDFLVYFELYVCGCVGVTRTQKTIVCNYMASMLDYEPNIVVVVVVVVVVVMVVVVVVVVVVVLVVVVVMVVVVVVMVVLWWWW